MRLDRHEDYSGDDRELPGRLDAATNAIGNQKIIQIAFGCRVSAVRPWPKNGALLVCKIPCQYISGRYEVLLKICVLKKSG